MAFSLADLSAMTSSARVKNFFLFEADLLDSDKVWSKIIEGCDCVVHAASPNVIEEPKDVENELIRPAVEGTERLLTLSMKLNVKRFVLISCITAIVTSNKKNYIFNQDDWADVKQLNNIARSKYLMERKAWEIYERNPDKIVFTSLVPGLMMGPSLKRTPNIPASCS